MEFARSAEYGDILLLYAHREDHLAKREQDLLISRMGKKTPIHRLSIWEDQKNQEKNHKREMKRNPNGTKDGISKNGEMSIKLVGTVREEPNCIGR